MPDCATTSVLPIHEEHDLLSNFDPAVGLVQVGRGINQPYHTDYKNFGPRLGMPGIRVATATP